MVKTPSLDHLTNVTALLNSMIIIMWDFLINKCCLEFNPEVFVLLICQGLKAQRLVFEEEQESERKQGGLDVQTV